MTRLTFAILLIVLSICLIVLLLAGIQLTQISSITVPDDYGTLQAAINAADNGDTIFVRKGIYYENVVVNKTVSLVGEDVKTTVIDGNSSTTVVRITSDNIGFTNFTVQGAGRRCNGIWLRSSGSLISHNIVMANNGWGIFFGLGANGNTVAENIVMNNSDLGIALYGDNHQVYGNNISQNGGSGILLHSGSNNSISENMLFNNTGGMEISQASNNLIHHNTIASNSIGVSLLHGNSGNEFHHNNFIGNNRQVSYSSNSMDSWDDGCEGNYWSDYSGTDLDDDGIGDTPHIIQYQITDPYPLMSPC